MMLRRFIAIGAFALATTGCGSSSKPAEPVTTTTARARCRPGETLITVPGGGPADNPLLHGAGCERTTFDTPASDSPTSDTRISGARTSDGGGS